jgi:ribosomal subunit interface protein
MKIEYVARKVDLGDDARQLAEKKLAKIKKYFNDILDVRLEVEQERHLFVADRRWGKDFAVKSTSQNKDLTTAIQDAIDKLEIQARAPRPD